MYKPRAFYGTLIHAPSPDALVILPNTQIEVSHDGKIISLTPDSPQPNPSPSLTVLSPSQFLIPGFIDTHNHAPQWTQRGLGQGMPLLPWLNTITFPNESKYSDEAHARKTYAHLVRGMLRQGVTMACYYSSLHGVGTKVLAETCHEHGQRAYIGKCNMDRDSPPYYLDPSPEGSIKTTEECIAHIQALDPSYSYIKPILTPRFAISCTPELLSGIGALAQKHPELPIQTHFNEAQATKDYTLSLFPDHESETSLYESFSLLRENSVLAHCTIMDQAETNRLAELNCGVAHCPTANMTVGGGFMAAPVRQFLDKGVKVGLGTDSGGGFSSSMLDAMRHSLIASFAREAHYPGEDKGLKLEEAFYMATMGGAKVVCMDDELGSFAVGKSFDALLIDMSDDRGGVNTPLQKDDSLRTIWEKFVMTGDDRNILNVFVKGKAVHTII